MPVRKSAANLFDLHSKACWKLMRLRHSPCYIAIMQTRLLDLKEPIQASLLYEHIDRDLSLLQLNYPDEFSDSTTPQKLVSDWVTESYLVRYRPQDSDEDVYELVPEVASVIRFITGLENRRSTLTESRLNTVLKEISLLAEETDSDATARLKSLRAERERIENEIASLEDGHFMPIDSDQALERVHEILSLTERLPDDFLGVRNHLDKLHRNLREKIVSQDGGRGDILHEIFNGVDVIAQSEAGRSFNSFWKLINDPMQNSALDSALSALSEREFIKYLDLKEWRFLENLTSMLLDRAALVHDSMNQFTHSLKQFVQSKAYQEQRRLQEVLSEARQQALVAKEIVKPWHKHGIPELVLSSIERSVVGEWSLYTPLEVLGKLSIEPAEDIELDAKELARKLEFADIDWDALNKDVSETLNIKNRAVSVFDILNEFPAKQGLASIVGLVHIASQLEAIGLAFRDRTSDNPNTEVVFWDGDDGINRSARIPIIFIREGNLIDSK